MEKVVSPKSFHLLQGIREEGEIVEDEEVMEDKIYQAPLNEDEQIHEREDIAGNKEWDIMRYIKEKGRGQSMIANTRGLVNAMINNQSKKLSSRRNR